MPAKHAIAAGLLAHSANHGIGIMSQFYDQSSGNILINPQSTPLISFVYKERRYIAVIQFKRWCSFLATHWFRTRQQLSLYRSQEFQVHKMLNVWLS